MGVLKLFSKDILKGAGDIIDNVVTSKEEKDKLKNEFSNMMMSHTQKMQNSLTERHKIDMSSDSSLSKNIRPLTLIFILGMYSIMSIVDGNISDVVINQAYVELLGQWGMLVMSFYFGSRGVEKVFELVGKYNIKNKKKR